MDLLKEIWLISLQMSPYLLLGFAFAGVLKVLIPQSILLKHLSSNNISSVFKAAAIGVPLPLCSCGVIPVTSHLQKNGASKGATLSFLTSTPTTGIDSIMATYSLLGLPFTVIRILASFFIGILSGTIATIFDKTKKEETHNNTAPCKNCCSSSIAEEQTTIPTSSKIKEIFKYGFFELIEDSAGWLVIGLLTGGLISYFIPADFAQNYLGSPFLAYGLMLLIGLPMYVCATGTIPIASALIAKGMTPGAALVFLIAGPATNTATISFVASKLGKKSLIIYLGSIIFGAVLFGIILDFVLINYATHAAIHHHNTDGDLSLGIQTFSTIIFIMLILRIYVIKIYTKIKK